MRTSVQEYVGSEKALRKSQQAWTDGRHAFCTARGITFTGGSMRAGVVGACYAMLARSRTGELRWLLGSPTGGTRPLW